MSRADDELQEAFDEANAAAERYGPQLDDLHEEELRGLRAEGSSAKPPKPTGNVCPDCAPVPIRVPTPSGRVRTVGMKHAHDCPTHRDERIPVSAWAQGRQWTRWEWKR